MGRRRCKRVGYASLRSRGSWGCWEFGTGCCCSNLGEPLLELLLGGVDEEVGLGPADFASNSVDAVTVTAHTTLDVFDGCSSRGDEGVLDVGRLAHKILASLHGEESAGCAESARRRNKKFLGEEGTCKVDWKARGGEPGAELAPWKSRVVKYAQLT